MITAAVVGIVLGAANHYWSLHAIGHSHPAGMVMDFAVGGYVCLLLMLMQRRLILGTVMSVTIVLGLYAASLAKFEVMQAAASFSDLLLLDDLYIHYAAVGGWPLVAVLVATAAFLLAFVLNLRRPSTREAMLFVPLLIYALVFSLKMFAPAAMAAGPLNVRSNYTWYPLAVVRGHWGYFFESGLAFAERRERYLSLKASVKPEAGFIGSTLTQVAPRNVHVIALESFIDPLSIPGVTVAPEPLAPLFQEWRRNGGLAAVQPVYAGRSPDGLFEILCGLPATLDESAIIFSHMTLPTIDCLPRKLAALGWRTESWVPVPPEEFTYDQAYARIGFETRMFDHDVDMSDRDGETLSAESILRQNLEHVKQGLRSGQPLFNHVFVTAGHFPFLLDTNKRPYRIGVQPNAKILAAYVNCAYYTSHAVQSYVDELKRIDPDGIIVILGDHPPGLPGVPKGVVYPLPIEARYDVPLIILDGERGAIDLRGRVPGYAIPGIVADLLTNGAYCRNGQCDHQRPIAARPLQQGLLAIEQRSGRIVDCAKQGASEVCRNAQHFADSAKLALLGFLGFE
ncbi:sulfatase-like hydrolase/transferase [Dongia deserti]|uniref:sulfatase-like hydrolase/transferase n=1 Tax=Dongia deserti TaxID=2268030 RepID=UPI0013C4210B|nr:sulfatase-like hydrolase/transferase [Dongia deserti]